MKNTIIRNLIIIAITLLSFFIVNNSNCVLAAAASHSGGSGGGTGDGLIGGPTGTFNPETWKPSSQTDATGATQIQNIGNSIIGFIQAVGSVLSVAVLAILGIKYMTGSVEEKAQYKKSMMPYLIGAIMIFAITNVLAIIVDIVKGVS